LQTIEHKAFYRRVEALLEGAPRAASPRRFGEWLLPRLFEQLGEPLGLEASGLFARRAKSLQALRHEGAECPDLAAVLERRLATDGGAEDGLAEPPWVGDTAAGTVALLAIPEGGTLFAALVLRGARAPDALPFVSALQFAITQHLKRRELEDAIEQARAIQLSLLPATPPAFGDFDIAAASVPARRVGGDLYDFISVDEDTLALTIADASGHGLPAALQARDVATGLRMGVERDLKITRTVEKLNRVIHRSGLSSRFISLVFGELERNGNFAYINAGHPPPLLLDRTGLHELGVGGALLGPRPDATYKLGFAHVDRGAALALYTDGVIERGAAEGEAFGIERLTQWLRDWAEGPGERAIADLLARLRAHGVGGPFDDDVTVVYVRRAG